jgi:propionyl-CoA synthetase
MVSRFAGVLADLGVGRGDRVIVYMPMIPEAIVAMLACARLGAVHSVVFGGFAPAELAARIDDAEPIVIVTASCGIEPSRVIEYKPLLDEALRLATYAPIASVVLQRPQAQAEMGPTDVDWHERISTAHPHAAVPVRATDPLYILYTSGTTGRPKGVVRDNGGHAVAMAWSFENVYGMGPDDTWWAASDVGWVVGHSYIAYAPLIAGATTLLYEGKPVGTPDAGAFWRVIEEYGVAALFTAPTAIRAIKKEDPDGALLADYDLSSLRTLFLAGERLDPDTYHWATDHLGVPVIDNWWQTETGWPIASNLRGLEPMPIKPGSPTVPVPGYDVRVVDGAGDDLPPGQDGAIVIRLPLPPGTLPTLWQDDQRYIDSYLSAFEGCYTTGDGGYIDEDGYVYVMGRTDDVINVAGHRLSTGSMEAVVAAHPQVAECAVIGVQDQMKGQVPRAFVVLKAGVDVDPAVLQAEIVAAVRNQIGPVAALKEVVIVPGLPKTRSGKILRRTMRGIADGRPEAIPSTIEDIRVLDVISPLLRG